MSEHGDEGSPNSMLGIGAQVSSALVGPVVLGVILDYQLGWSPWGTLAGIGLGLVGMMAILIRMANRSRE